MKSIIDRDQLNQRARIAHVASLGGLVLLLGCVAFSLWQPQQSTISAILLVGGFAVSATGIFLANRWVKKPRPEDVLDKVLKGYGDQFRLYHYKTPCDHLLLMPQGLVVFETINLDGVFTYENDRWKQKISMNRAVRFLFEERLGNPTRRAEEAAKNIAARLSSRLPGKTPVPAEGIVVFVHPAAEVEIKNAALPVCNPKNLQKRLPTRLPKLPPEIYKQIQEILDETAETKNRNL